MTQIDQSASPGTGPEQLPTPALPGTDQSASPGTGPEQLPTPALPGTPSQPGQTVLPNCTDQTSPNCSCPIGYTRRTVRRNQTFADLLLENNVSYAAMQNTNPMLSTQQPTAGTVYCAPPSSSRRVCSYGSRSYVMGEGETLYTLVGTFGTTAANLLQSNPELAPSDFVPGRVVCIP